MAQPNLLAPFPCQNYIATPSGTAYASNNKGVITSVATAADYAALIALGCTPLNSGDTGRSVFSTVPIGSVAYTSFGNNTTLGASTMYFAEIFVPRAVTLTGIGVLNGATVGTDKGLVALYDTTGTLLANSAVAGATTSGANAFQTYAFTSTYAAYGPARFFVAYQSNGTTDTMRMITTSTFVDTFTTSKTSVTFGTVPSTFTVPTTFTTNVGPIAYAY